MRARRKTVTQGVEGPAIGQNIGRELADTTRGQMSIDLPRKDPAALRSPAYQRRQLISQWNEPRAAAFAMHQQRPAAQILDKVASMDARYLPAP